MQNGTHCTDAARHAGRDGLLSFIANKLEIQLQKGKTMSDMITPGVFATHEEAVHRP